MPQIQQDRKKKDQRIQPFEPGKSDKDRIKIPAIDDVYRQNDEEKQEKREESYDRCIC